MEKHFRSLSNITEYDCFIYQTFIKLCFMPEFWRWEGLTVNRRREFGWFFAVVVLLCFFSPLILKKITVENGRQAGKLFFKEIILGEFTNNKESQEGSGSCLDILREEKDLM